MKRGKIDTSQIRSIEKSPRGSFSERSPLLTTARTSSYPRNNFASVEEELAHLPYKDSEIENLAKEIGIDLETEKDKYLWFLVQVVNLDLPPGWMKEEDPLGAIYYINPTENINSAKHPMIAKFRSLFNEILENEINGKAKTLALKEKVQKLEKEVEVVSPTKKPMREGVLKLDKAKKFKAAATAIGMMAALSHKTLRSETQIDRNLTKPVIPEQAMSIVDSEKTKQKFNKVRDMLEKRRAVQEKKVNEIDNLVKTEDILNACKQYYIDQFGTFHKEAPPQLSQLETFDLVDPMELIEAARLFNVRSSQAHLFWTLRAYCGLPLPEYWTKMYDTNMHREIYYNSAHDVKISVKPCYFYILELVNYIKQESMRDRDGFLNASNKLTLCDKLGREYDVDLAAMIKDLIEKQNVERKNYFNYHQKKETVKEEAQKVTKRRKKDEFNPNYSDAHFVEIAKQLGVDLDKEIHLLMTIEDFVRNKEGLERWYFRQAQEGQSFWVNHEQQKAVNRYPYLNDLKKIIDEVRANLKLQSLEAQKHLKSDFNLFKMLFRKYPEEAAKKMLQDEARNYLEFFLKMKGDGQINNLNLDTKGYNLTNLMRKIGMQLTKGDLMDLLFYCPFDFTHFIGEDFLKSSENYLLRKINLKLGGEAKKSVAEDDDDLGPREGSFDSQDSNDSAKNIKLKIEDSKKLLDLASNIKGLSLDPDRKREFMKLLIDFDQKYGDRDLVDALEQDVSGKLQDGASSAKSLANSIKNKMGKSITGGKDSEDLGSSGLYGTDKAQRFLIDTGKDSPNRGNSLNRQDSNSSKLRRTGDVLGDQSSSSRIIPKLKPDGRSDSSRDLKLNKKGIKSDGYNLADGKEGGIGDDDIYSAGLATDRRNRRGHKDGLKRQKSKFNNNNNANDDDDEEQELDDQGLPTGRSRNRREGRGRREGKEGRDESDERGEDGHGKKHKKHKKRRNGGGTNSGGNSGSFGNLSGGAAGSRSRSGVSSLSGSANTMENVGEEDEESEGEYSSSSDEFSEISESENDDDVSEARYDDEGRRIRKKKNVNKSNSSKRREKLEYDENGKIIFTNKRTQKLLEELAEEEFRLSARHKFKGKKRGNRHRSAQGSMEEEEEEQLSIFGQGKLGQAFGDHKIVYHEVVMENGETKMIAINVKTKNRKPRKLSNGTSEDSLDESRSPPNGWEKSVSPADLKDFPGKLGRNLPKKVAAELNQSRDDGNKGLPIVIGASLKHPGQNRFDANQLIDSLHKYNVDALDEAYQKEERRKEDESANRLSYIDDSKMGDATGLSSSRVQMTPLLWHKVSDPKKREPIRIPQTYRNLSSGLQNLDLIKKKNTYEKTGKQGVWTHVEVFEMKPGPDEQKTDRHHRAASETIKMPISARTSVSPRHANIESTFFTPFRQGNLGMKRFIEYMSYLNTLVFIKKLDTLITNFLMKQFAAIQQTALGINFNPNDPKFRNTFKTRYHKLIKQLRENLLKKKDFLNNIYAKVFNSAEELPESIFQSVNHIKDIPKDIPDSKSMTANKSSVHQSFISGHNPRAAANKSQSDYDQNIKQPRSSSLKGSQSQSNLHLPKVGGRRPGLEPFRLSQKGFFTPRVGNDDEKFTDNNIRNTEGGKEDTPLQEIKNPLGKLKKGHLTLQGFRQNEANKILQALNENDQENYRHYWNILGDPLKLESTVALSRSAPAIGAQPYHVLLMARRLGLQVHNSEEHDLAWIAYLALTVKLPSNAETNLMITSPRNPARYQKVCNMKPGEHPGDKYFRTVLVYHQLRRRILLEQMTSDDQTKYIKSQSWIKLKEDTGSMYYHNFMTKQKTINMPSDQKDIVSRVSALTLRSDIKEKLILTHQTIMENDHLLNFFRNKLPTNL